LLTWKIETKQRLVKTRQGKQLLSLDHAWLHKRGQRSQKPRRRVVIMAFSLAVCVMQEINEETLYGGEEIPQQISLFIKNTFGKILSC
jgi:hypothetical protein